MEHSPGTKAGSILCLTQSHLSSHGLSQATAINRPYFTHQESEVLRNQESCSPESCSHAIKNLVLKSNLLPSQDLDPY